MSADEGAPHRLGGAEAAARGDRRRRCRSSTPARWRAASTRTRSTYRAGVTPTSSVNDAAEVPLAHRGPRRRAGRAGGRRPGRSSMSSCASRIGRRSARWRSTPARRTASARRGGAGTSPATGRRSGRPRLPWSSSTSASARSMPAVTPADVHTLPSRCVDRVGVDRQPRVARRPAASARAQCVVTVRPSSRPASAARNAPLHTVATRRLRAPRRADPVDERLRRARDVCAPSPPGINSVSILVRPDGQTEP